MRNGKGTVSRCWKWRAKEPGADYIWDKRTKILEESMSNATNPEYQWLFCTEKHFKEWESQRKQESEKELNLTWNKLQSEKGNLEVPNFPSLEELKQKQEKEELESYVKEILREIKLIKESQAKQGSSSVNSGDKDFFEKNKWLIIGGGIGGLVLIGGLFFVWLS